MHDENHKNNTPQQRANRLLAHLAHHLEDHASEIGNMDLQFAANQSMVASKLELAQTKMQDAALLMREAADLLLSPREIH